MDPTLSLIECAYSLARSGECRDVSDVVERLKAEGFANVQIEVYSGSLADTLRMILAEVAASG